MSKPRQDECSKIIRVSLNSRILSKSSETENLLLLVLRDKHVELLANYVERGTAITANVYKKSFYDKNIKTVNVSYTLCNYIKKAF